MQAIESRIETVDFPLDQGLELPLDSKHRPTSGGYHVFTSANSASYIVATSDGARIVELLGAGHTLRQTLDSIARERDLTEEESWQRLSEVLLQVEKNGFYEGAQVVEDEPDFFPMLCYLTRMCNLSCSHCYMSAGPTVSTEHDLPADTWKSVFTQYRAALDERPQVAGKITLSGGEALIRRDFFEIAESAKGMGVYLELFSNGTLIQDERLAARLAEHFDSVQISLDGGSPEVNDSIRGVGVHRRVVRALKLETDAGMKVRLAVTLMPSNATDIACHLAEVLEECRGGGEIELRLGLANVQGRADSSVRYSNSVEGEEALRRTLSSLEEMGVNRLRRIVSNFRAVTCGYGRTLNIGSDGTVYGCAIEALPLGNVKEVPLKEMVRRVWDLSRAAEVDNTPGCSQCDIRYLCNGGCRLVNLSRKGDFRKPACTPAKRREIVEKLVRRELATSGMGGRVAGVDAFWF